MRRPISWRKTHDVPALGLFEFIVEIHSVEIKDFCYSRFYVNWFLETIILLYGNWFWCNMMHFIQFQEFRALKVSSVTIWFHVKIWVAEKSMISILCSVVGMYVGCAKHIPLGWQKQDWKWPLTGNTLHVCYLYLAFYISSTYPKYWGNIFE